MPRDPEKAKARSRRYRERQKIARYGSEAAGVDMRGRHGNHARGPANGKWTGGVFHHSEGYIGIRVPVGHHLRQAHGYAYEHDLVAEENIGRRLEPGELVHHRNGIRSDNRWENLCVETRSDHSREHTSVPGARDELGRFSKATRLRP